MKKLGKLQINPERLMKNEELLVLRGGYGGSGWCTCRNYEGGILCSGWVDCYKCYSECLEQCPGTHHAICAG
jgi:hypothetical protein